MRKLIYREGPFLDREKEELFILNRLKSRPENILFIYGPKSSGKTTFIEYIVEEKLGKEKDFYVNYVNFRGYALVNYSSFLNIYFQKIEDETKPWIAKARDRFGVNFGRIKGEITLPYQGINIGLNWELFEKVQRNEVDPFDVFFETLRRIKSKGRQPVLIIDEVQELSEIYMNGELSKRHLLTEFFKFLMRLTKETHLAHILVLTSSSVFIDEIYNHSNLAKASEFYLFDHFNYDVVQNWLQEEGFSGEEIELIWEYLGGCPFDLITLIANKKNWGKEFNLSNYLKEQAEIMAGKIDFTLSREFSEDSQIECFLELLQEIIAKGYARKPRDRQVEAGLKVGIEKDLLFLIPNRQKIIFNSKLVQKGAEIYLEDLT